MADPTRRRALATLGAALAWGTASPAATAWALDGPRGRPLPRAHAHNDYDHPQPLFDALDHRFGSIEADIHLVDGALLVGHDAADLDPAHTLESLYLDPLHALVKTNQGSVYQGWPTPVQLLIDIKTDGAATYLELDRHLRRYQQILTAYRHGKVHQGPVTAVVSGARGTRAPLAAQQVRHAFCDGHLTDLGSSASVTPLISEDWTAAFTWRGNGPFPAEERAKLRKIVSTAHAHRQRVRFWSTPDGAGPDREALWRELYDAGTDLLNTDDLAGLEMFLTARGGH
ncbi:phosphatidylinositol-specific phospholipase C/glycerophosphodiester phosphodiesterase family protein [Streptomyces odontomachi]|uniref:phosphatidylinositol-specific phospholipase C/glycerophosphodiester phosphodiesterase family protein n=1 Tax=Streptomyces odontomachi TaxID=2944940 RepID=UPI00210A5617|nr:phosphatidylinositol-specific phospholipase C/glycerophosphodiester phosphodiesterase family protein [Streptomyces sp. ODS25]